MNLPRTLAASGALLVLSGCSGFSGGSGSNLLAPDPSASPPASVLIASPTGISFVGAEGVVRKLVRGKAVISVDDGRGGLLFQRSRGRFHRGGGSTAIRWIMRGGATAVDLVEPARGEHLALHDVIEINGALAVFYTRSEGSNIDDSKDVLVRLDPRAKTAATLHQVGGWEWGSDPISVTPTLIGFTVRGLVNRQFEFLNRDGVPRDLRGNPPPTQDCNWCPDLVELSDDAGTLAYIEFPADADGYRIVPEVVLADAGSGQEQRRLRLDRPEGGWMPASLDLGDGIVVVNRLAIGETDSHVIRPWLIDFRGKAPVVWEAPIAGTARLVRSTPEIKASAGR